MKKLIAKYSENPLYDNNIWIIVESYIGLEEHSLKRASYYGKPPLVKSMITMRGPRALYNMYDALGDAVQGGNLDILKCIVGSIRNLTNGKYGIPWNNLVGVAIHEHGLTEMMQWIRDDIKK